MLNMIKADFYRFRKSRIFFGMILGMLVFLLMGNISAHSNGDGGLVTFINDLKNLNEIDFYKKGSESMIELLTGSNFLANFLIPIVLFSFISDFRWGTIKNSVPFKYSRSLVYLSKYLFSVLLAFFVPIIYALLGLLLNQLFNGFSGVIRMDDFLTVGKIALLQLPIYAGITGVLMLIGIVFQSSTVVIAFMAIYQLGGNFLFSMIPSEKFADYEPMTCLDLAAYFNHLAQSDFFSIIVTGLVLTIVSAMGGLLLFRKKAIR